jgi:geranylgeranyl pyrophosphate synthase
VQLGALAGNASAVELNALDQFADEIGLAFQIQDDILDIESPTEVLGKRQGADIALQKPTFPAILGMAEAKAYLGKKYRAALSHLHAFNHNKVQPLQQLAEYMVQRNF